MVDPLERVIAYMDYCYGPGQVYLDEEFMSGEYGSSYAYKLADYIARWLRELHPRGLASCTKERDK